MLLAVDIGNSSIDIGVFAEDDSLIMKSKISSGDFSSERR